MGQFSAYVNEIYPQRHCLFRRIKMRKKMADSAGLQWKLSINRLQIVCPDIVFISHYWANKKRSGRCQTGWSSVWNLYSRTFREMYRSRSINAGLVCCGWLIFSSAFLTQIPVGSTKWVQRRSDCNAIVCPPVECFDSEMEEGECCGYCPNGKPYICIYKQVNWEWLGTYIILSP